jgi:drug/metabolite transporter (DMT)-like permease
MTHLSHTQSASERSLIFPANTHVRGIIYMVAASLFFTIMHVFAKRLSTHVPIAEISFFRSIITLVIIAPWMLYKKESFLGYNRKLLFIRGIFGFSSLFLGFFAISQIRLGDVTVLWKTSVVFTAAFAAFFLKERVTPTLMSLIGLAMVGAALIVKPGFEVMNLGGLAALMAGIFVGIVTISVRELHKTESSLTIIFSFSLWATLMSVVLFGHQFIVPPATDLLSLILMGIAGTIGQLWFTAAFIYAPASVTQPYAFSEVIFSMFAGLLLWGEVPDVLSLLGSGLIIISGIGILRAARPPVTADV